jgi:predicted nuclease with TOPRIM domain
MQEFLATTLGIVVSSGAVGTVVILGILYIAGLWKKGKNGEDDRLITILKGTVDALEEKVNNQKKEHDDILSNLTREIKELTEKVDNLDTENTRLVEILQGRDTKTQEFYEKAIRSFTLVENMNSNMADLLKALGEHFKSTVTINNQSQK